ncbi:MAG: malate dehydrogenase [Candidatus Kerfeldbacteria bacterium RIFOXYA2_FULL_38_24]|uniref:Malate dehydrogenase n=1 Tax=Candidatus Kerfeldbacteria bacterium RIFOXYB2_FULL_38_14 TaxID=1798547 RepID=A0A1G2BBL8_9BACT|nr:MAG: malate dehydrogenase [Candidatus Kerfeldbacteria bacterium RIFOXYA2_FULL_38_24]OGY85680.1 MAG: malate dehydrogenase [Candidatus Kerfeldbacteria bacterium RIFOXYB2_FULL_38_14]OGY88366.1 MAG: malate dehydrogenase [Candidatus Kerfeldbacteria bacterium RIFOXYC2_FULL_38_9]
MDQKEKALALHKKYPGKIGLAVKTKITSREDLSLAYSPGVAEPCKKIAENVEDVWKYTARRNLVAVISDGSAVLGLGNIGAEAGLPVMEGKAVLFKEFGNVDAFPLMLATQDVEEIIKIVKALEPTFGGINLEDISAPRCFEIEERLKKEMHIPVFHDDQHGTAVVVLAGLINALNLTNRKFADIKIVISGAGAAGVAIAKILLARGAKNIVAVDSKGIVAKNRQSLNESKKKLLALTNPKNITGNLTDAMKNADVFIGVSAPGIVTPTMVRSMNTDPIIFAMANPIPEIMPDEARAAGAAIVGTGRSDFPNQVNNVLAFPGIFRGVLDVHAPQITEEMKLAAADALANYVKNPTPENIIPDALDKNVVAVVAKAVSNCAKNSY